MHHCLEIDEILAVIVDYAYESRPTYDAAEGISVQRTQLRGFDKATVLALALTCRSFTDAALNRLWHSQKGIDRVLRTLPADAWSEKRADVHITRPLSIADWGRFDYYAGKVRVLEFQSSRIHNRPPENSYEPSPVQGFHYLFTGRKIPLLFSQLRHFTWSGIGNTGLAPLFVGQQLELLNLTLSVLQRAHQAYVSPPDDLKFALGILPRLQCFFIHNQMIRTPVEPCSAWDIFGSCSNLRVVRVDLKLSTNDLVRIALMPSLVEFHFVANSNDDLAPLLMIRDQPLFPSLRTIALGQSRNRCGADISSCAALLEKMNPGVLQDISLEVVGTSSSAMRSKLLSSLRMHRSTLRKLRLVGLRTNPAPIQLLREQDVFEDSELAPLLSFTGLTHLWLSFICRYDLGDSIVHRMADSWPALQSLKIGVTLGWDQRSRVTTYGLARLIKTCPQMRELALPIDISRNCLDPERDELPQSHHITAIDLMDSAIVTEDEGALDTTARCFAALLPELTCIKSTRPLWQLPRLKGPDSSDTAQACWTAIRNKIVMLCPDREYVVSKHDNMCPIPRGLATCMVSRLRS
ncbi:uncharacterized protein FIBRA_05100 [Fibroporia radiculosa]|uniref:F-box domain-containing protein n=1 Tax=Fibroporia radiculosa TaxID=599839 RepID=J4GQE1_9APHY|nr:uncharacterized protein FIBRA_05100 [Fibroporia radiculosa]CCM02985.1 predicted protein [Fibroporia radiculosa]